MKNVERNMTSVIEKRRRNSIKNGKNAVEASLKNSIKSGKQEQNEQKDEYDQCIQTT